MCVCVCCACVCARVCVICCASTNPLVDPHPQQGGREFWNSDTPVFLSSVCLERPFVASSVAFQTERCVVIPTKNPPGAQNGLRKPPPRQQPTNHATKNHFHQPADFFSWRLRRTAIRCYAINKYARTHARTPGKFLEFSFPVPACSHRIAPSLSHVPRKGWLFFRQHSVCEGISHPPHIAQRSIL